MQDTRDRRSVTPTTARTIESNNMDGIFIVGTGRSGTHFLCRTMLGFANVDDYLGGEEDSQLLYKVAHQAMTHQHLSRRTMWHYRRLLRKARKSGTVFLDQHHPNLYHLQQLHRAFPDAVFLYPKRPAEQVVASMINHGGVSGWYDKIRGGLEIPFPNSYFGLEELDQINSLPIHLLCAKRVVAHEKRVDQALDKLKGTIRSVSYEALVTDRDKELNRVFSDEERTRLGDFHEFVAPDPASLSKYTETLSPSEVNDIRSLVANHSGP